MKHTNSNTGKTQVMCDKCGKECKMKQLRTERLYFCPDYEKAKKEK